MPGNLLFKSKDRWEKSESDILRELLKRDFGVVNYATFYETGEGRRLPTGIEDFSVAVLTTDESVKTYNIEWDSNKENPDGGKGYYFLRMEDPWSKDEVDSLEQSVEYISARQKLGLSITPEQQKILDERKSEVS